MMTALLATCDPCGYVQGGDSPTRYMPLAAALAARFGERGCHPVDLYLQFPDEADAATAMQVCEAATDWWSRDRDAVSRCRVAFA